MAAVVVSCKIIPNLWKPTYLVIKKTQNLNQSKILFP